LFWRATAVLLLTLNVAALGYGYFNPAPPIQPRAKVEADTPSLTLLSERGDTAMAALASSNSVRASQAVAATATPSENASTAISARCLRLGPFNDADAAERTLSSTQAFAEQVQVKQDSVRQTRGYWVYLTPESNRETSLKTARQLSAANIRDYYVVTAGENENAISLGMFKDAINADKRIAQIAALGFFPKRAERYDEKTRFFIEFSPRENAADAGAFDAKWLQQQNLPQGVSVADFRCKS
jgi:hypothetical protein